MLNAGLDASAPSPADLSPHNVIEVRIPITSGCPKRIAELHRDEVANLVQQLGYGAVSVELVGVAVARPYRDEGL